VLETWIRYGGVVPPLAALSGSQGGAMSDERHTPSTEFDITGDRDARRVCGTCWRAETRTYGFGSTQTRRVYVRAPWPCEINTLRAELAVSEQRAAALTTGGKRMATAIAQLTSFRSVSWEPGSIALAGWLAALAAASSGEG